MISQDQARQLLVKHNGNVRAASREAGIARSTWRCKFGSVKQTTPLKKETTVVFADIHAPYHDEEALASALEYAATLNPDRVVINGDFLDCYAISHWRKDPSRGNFPEEVRAAREVLEQITEELPTARDRVYLEGNHESRLRDYLWGKAAELWGLDALTVPELLKCNELGWRYISNSKNLIEGGEVYHVGKLAVFHGHEVKASMAAVNIPRIYYFKCHENLLVAHHHQTQEFIAHKLNGQHDGAWSVGCLCKLNAEYMPVTNWCHGFSVVESDDTGNFVMQNKIIIEGVVR